MIRTPETNPEHPFIGKYFKAFGCLYYCASEDGTGFNMVPVLNEHKAWLAGTRNVSGMAINRTYWLVYREVQTHLATGRRVWFHCQHRITEEEQQFLLAKYEEAHV